ncbi:chondrolectin [Girardinichthys multiradiatus]|uniref:chondrolectin n=1 Tax=Girardinichthys multiradiatus TaxID=208333 RepID=UPI001FAC5865|nr:chondrolectin [Girardinichthys multiradiatus]
MDFMRLFGTVIAVLFHPGSASKIHGQKICRRGTERPCYRASYIQDSRRRLTFDDARQSCRSEGGELLSIETESEQRLIESFIQKLRVGDGDFWIGLQRSLQHHRTGNSNPGCPSRYYWVDGSKAKYRNWNWDEPSCGTEMCVVLYHQPTAPTDEEGHFLFKWNDDNCSSKNNFVCKYREEKIPVYTGDRILVQPVPSMRPNISIEGDVRITIGSPESSVSFSDNSLYVPYILYATIPALLLLLLLAAGGFFCYRQHAKRRKTETESFHSRSKQLMPTAASSSSVQGPYAFSDITKLPHAALDCRMQAEIMTKYSCPPSHDAQYADYENVTCSEKETGFVTNDIYEMSRTHSQHCCSQTGWVENEIYG